MNGGYTVAIADVARQDLRSLRAYLVATAGVQTANKVVQRLLLKIEALSRFPERGPIPRELVKLQPKHYRQTSAAPYRIIYKIDGQRVIVLVIADGRRDFQKLLTDRHLR